MNLSELKPNPNNPRIIKDDNFKKLCESIKEFPKMMELRPIIIDDDNTILGGNMRLKALVELNYTEIPDNWVKKASDYTDEEKRKFIIKDNVSFGGWDWDILANEWEKDLLLKWGLEIRDYHDINDLNPDEFEGLNDNLVGDDLYHLNMSFDTQDELNEFMKINKIILDNNYKRVGKVISIHYPLEERRDIKNVEFK